MSRKKKTLLIVVLVPLLLIACAFLFIDQLAKKAVEIGGEQAMGVPTAVDGVSLSPFRGEGSIKGLQISNPGGFESPYFMHLSKAGAAMDVGSVLKDTVVMKSIELDGLKVHLEKTKAGSNYEVILGNMKKGEEKGPGEEPGKKFLVRDVVVKNISVDADVVLVVKKTVHLNIDEIHLENVGSDTDSGVIMSQLMGTIVKAVLTAIVQQGAELLPDIAKDLGSNLAGLGKVGVKVIGNVTGQVGDEAVKALGGAGKAVGGAIKGIGGILGGGDDKKEDDK